MSILHTLRARISPANAPTLLLPFAACGVAGVLVGGVTLLLQGILPGVFNHLANSGAVWSVGAFVAGALLVYREAPGVLVPATASTTAATADGATTDAAATDEGGPTTTTAAGATVDPVDAAPSHETTVATVTAARTGTALGHARGQWIPVIGGLLVEVGAVIGYYASATIFKGDDLSAAALRGPLVWIVVAFLAGPLYGLAGAAYRGSRHREKVAAAALLGAVFVAEAGYLLAVLHYGGEALLMSIVGLAVPVALGRSNRARVHGLLAVLVLIPLGLLAMWLLSLGVDMAFTA